MRRLDYPISRSVSFPAALIFCLKHREHPGLTAKYLRPRAERVRDITGLGLTTAGSVSIGWFCCRKVCPSAPANPDFRKKECL